MSSAQPFMSTLPTDRPQQHRFLSVDFVTALTLDECREFLLNSIQAGEQAVTMLDDNSFAVQRRVEGEKPKEVRFWGTLETVETGTWVWGTVIQTSEGGRKRSTYGLVFVVVILLGLMVDALTRNSLQNVLILSGVLAGLAVLGAVIWRQRNQYGLQVMSWVYETLYVAPQRE
jgi:hypothetical protein